jgi:hypothetical protein
MARWKGETQQILGQGRQFDAAAGQQQTVLDPVHAHGGLPLVALGDPELFRLQAGVGDTPLAGLDDLAADEQGGDAGGLGDADQTVAPLPSQPGVSGPARGEAAVSRLDLVDQGELVRQRAQGSGRGAGSGRGVSAPGLPIPVPD